MKKAEEEQAKAQQLKDLEAKIDGAPSTGNRIFGTCSGLGDASECD